MEFLHSKEADAHAQRLPVQAVRALADSLEAGGADQAAEEMIRQRHSQALAALAKFEAPHDVCGSWRPRS